MPFPPYTFDRSKVSALAFVVVIALAGMVMTIGPIKTARAGNTWQVDKSYASDLCNSDNLRCRSLKDAVAAAESGDRIRITTGRYDGENDILIENKNLTIIGAGQIKIIPFPGGGGGTIPDETSGTWITANNNCPFGCPVLTSLGRVFHVKNSTVNISGMWITDGNSHGGNGGAVLNEGGTVTLSDVRINADSDGGNGGAVYNDQGTISFTDCSIGGSSGSFQLSGPVGGNGGGIYNDRGTLHITRCSVSGNIGHSEFRDAGNGGGLFNKGGTVTINNSAVENSRIGTASDGNMPGTTPNRAGFNGGRGSGIYNEYPGKITITDSEIRSNETSQGGAGGDGAGFSVGPGFPGGNGGAGGGIYNEGEMTITGSSIAGNKTGGGGGGGASATSPGSGSDGGVGGGIYNAGTLTMVNSTISDNATGEGGRGGTAATDTTPGGNGGSGGRGGGIYNQDRLTLTNVTISGNTTGGGGAGASSSTDSGTAGSAGHGGGVVSAPQVSGANITLLNTIIAGNTTAAGGSEPDVVGPFVSTGHNLIGVTDSNGFDAAGDQQGSSASPLNAKLGPRQSNGGPTSTYDLLDASPAINAGDDSVTGSPSNLKYDQRGVGYIRKFNGQVDIGAVEKQPPSHPPVAACVNSIVSAQSSCQYTLSPFDVDGGSSDPDLGDTITLSLDQSGPFGLGTHNVTLTVEDSRGLSSSCVAQVTVVDDLPPTLSVPPSRIFFTGPGSTTAGITISNLDSSLGTATASDNCSVASLVRTGVPAGNFFPIGNTTVTYTATDTKGLIASASQGVTVVDNTAPKITAPADRTFYTGPGATLAGVVLNNLDASLGTAAVSDNDSIISTVRNGVPAGNFFPIGTTVLTYTTTDKSGNMASATQRVRVIDNTPPTITGAFVNPSVIWPPNKKMVDVFVSYNAGDNSAGSVVTGLSISSNEPTSAADMLVLDAHHVRVRADRAGNGTGRIYTIVITATDSNGNSFRQTVKVTVPHDQGK